MDNRSIKKLNLDKKFTDKLSSIIKTKSGSNLKKLQPKKKSKFTISDDNTPFIPNTPNIPNVPKINTSSNQEYKEKELKFSRLMMENVTEIGLMWESFDDSIKKIVLSEIIEKFYLYKTWKFNSLAFISGFLFAMLLVFFFKIIT